MRNALKVLRTSSLSDWMAMAIFAFAFVGCVEAPWIVGGLS